MSGAATSHSLSGDSANPPRPAAGARLKLPTSVLTSLGKLCADLQIRCALSPLYHGVGHVPRKRFSGSGRARSESVGRNLAARIAPPQRGRRPGDRPRYQPARRLRRKAEKEAKLARGGRQNRKLSFWPTWRGIPGWPSPPGLLLRRDDTRPDDPRETWREAARPCRQ